MSLLGKVDELIMRVNRFALRPLLWVTGALWIPIAVAVTGLAALVCGAIQQDLRQSANDPQVQLAEDAAAQLDQDVSPASVLRSVPSPSTDRWHLI